MINFLSKWIEGIAVAVIMASIFEMILPNGNIKKYIKVVLGIFIIFSIISPFVNKKVLYDIELPKELKDYTIQNTINAQTEDLNKIYKNTFEKEIIQTVKKNGYEVYKCNVEGNFDAEKQNVGITKIELVLESKILIEEEKNDNTIKIKDVEKIEIGEKKEDTDLKKITDKEIKQLKKALSERYEIEPKTIDIQIR